MNKSVRSLCTNKFEPLQEYFEPSLLVEDLASVSDSDIVDCAVFYSNVLESILDNPDPFDSAACADDDESEHPRHTSSICNNIQDDVIAYWQILPTSHYNENPNIKLPSYMKCMHKLNEDLLTKPNLVVCKVFDVSKNGLGQLDGPYIVKCTKLLPNCQFVDLQVNRISDQDGVPEWLFELAALPNIKFIRILKNVLATSECIDFWKQVNKRSQEEKHPILQKLIWVDEYWIDKQGGWKNIIKPEFIDVVKQVHEDFYTTYANW